MKLELYETNKGEETPTSLKARWVAALRSGEYKQGEGQLRRNEEYCCLGVLCDVMDKNKWSLSERKHEYLYDNKYGWRISNKVLLDTIQNALMDMNDERGKNFTEIADYIEANVDVTE